MTILKSKAFWAITGTTASIASALTYDKYAAHKIRSQFLQEAQVYGEEPLKEGEHERKVSLLYFVQAAEDETGLKKIFREHAVELLSKAGVDYQWIGRTAEALDKRYYQLKEEKEIREISNGEVPAEEPSKKPPIFSHDNYMKPLATSWFAGKKPDVSEDKLLQEVFDENIVMSLDRTFFTDGIIALDPGSFRALLWSAEPSAQPSLNPSLGLINCQFPSSFLKRLYYRFNTRKIAEVVGSETMAVIRAEARPTPIHDILPSETSPNNTFTFNIFR